MLFDNAMHLGEPQPGALGGARGEKGFENMGQHRRRNPWSTIGNNQHDPRPRADHGGRGDLLRREIQLRQIDAHRATLWHHLPGVVNQVKQHLLQLGQIAIDMTIYDTGM